MALRRQIINFIRADLLHQTNQISRIGHITVMQKKLAAGVLFLIFKNMVYAGGIKTGSAAFNAVNLVSFGQQKFRQQRAVLSGGAGNHGYGR